MYCKAFILTAFSFALPNGPMFVLFTHTRRVPSFCSVSGIKLRTIQTIFVWHCANCAAACIQISLHMYGKVGNIADTLQPHEENMRIAQKNEKYFITIYTWTKHFEPVSNAQYRKKERKTHTHTHTLTSRARCVFTQSTEMFYLLPANKSRIYTPDRNLVRVYYGQRGTFFGHLCLCRAAWEPAIFIYLDLEICV